MNEDLAFTYPGDNWGAPNAGDETSLDLSSKQKGGLQFAEQRWSKPIKILSTA